MQIKKKIERLLSNSYISFKKLNTFVESLNLLVMPLVCGVIPDTQWNFIKKDKKTNFT